MRLGDVCTLVLGQSPSSDSYNADGDGFPFYQGNADFGKEHPKAKVWCNAPKKTARAGDILLSVRAPIGAVNTAEEVCCIGRGVAAVRPNPSKVNAVYLKQQLLARRALLESKGTGSTFKAVGKKVLTEFPVILYSLPEQEALARKLQTIQDNIRVADQKLFRLDLLIKSRFVEMFKAFQLGSCTMSDLLSDIVSGTNVGGSQRPLEDGEYGVLKISAVTQGIFKPQEYKVVNDVSGIKMVHPRKGDLLFSRANTQEMVGATAIVDDDYDRLFLPDKLWRLDLKDGVDTSFAKYLLSSPEVRAEMSQSSTGTSGSMKNISMAKFRRVPAFLPPLALQREFADFAARIDKLRFVVSGGS